MNKQELERENKRLKELLRRKDLEISELIHMHREVDKRMDEVFKEMNRQQEQKSWWERLFY